MRQGERPLEVRHRAGVGHRRDQDVGVLTLDRKVKPVGTACVTIDPAAYKAFSILLGVAPEALTETQALADQNGWLRSRWRPGDPDDWNDPQMLLAVIRDIVTHPLSVASGGGHAHHH